MAPLPVIPEYDLGAELGRGAIGVVHEATHRPTGAQVAIKVVLPDGPRARAALRHEVLAMARLNHPHVLFLYDTGVVDGAVWMAMERATGGTLEAWRPHTWGDMEERLDDLLAGMAYAHARGVLHRDLKPANLLMARASDERPGLKVADFGLTSLRDQGTVYKRGGTPEYMPPEQIRTDFGPPGPWSDIYALGAMLWQWVCARPVFDGGTNRELMDAHVLRPLPPLEPAFDVPDAVVAALPRMLAKAPGERPQSIADVRDLLGRTRSLPVRHERTQVAASARRPGLGARLVPLREWRLVGRDDAWFEVLDALEEVRTSGAPTVLVVSGPAGIGKTHLVRAVAEGAAHQGVARLEWQPDDLGRVLSVAARGPVIVCIDELDAASEELVASLAFARAPILVLATCRNARDWPDLALLPRYREMVLGPMNAERFRHFLIDELGVEPTLSLPMGAACGDVPGVATAWLSRLSRQGALLPGAEGYRFDRALLAEPPTLGGLDVDGVDALVVRLPEAERIGLRLGAMLGEVVSVDVLAAALEALGLEPTRLAYVELTRAGWTVPHPRGFRWVDQRVAAHLAQGATTRQHEVLAEALSSLDPSPAGVVLCGRHLLAAGRVGDARKLLLDTHFEPTPMEQERLRQSVELLRDHMGDASAEERAGWLCMELRMVLNFVSSAAAVPLARGVLEAVGRPGGPGSLGEGVYEGLRTRALHLAALVLSFEDLDDEALAAIDGLPESADTLRVRGLVALTRHDGAGAIAHYERAMNLAESRQLQARIANGLGMANGGMGHHEHALHWFLVAAELLDPHLRYIARQNATLCRLQLGRFEEACDDMRSVFHDDRRRGRLTASLQTAPLFALSAALSGREDDVASCLDEALFVLRRNPESVNPAVMPLEAIHGATPAGPKSRALLEALRDFLAR